MRMRSQRNLLGKSLLGLTILLFSATMIVPLSASSSTTYTYALDDENNYIRTQDAYLPGQTVTALGLNKPADLAIDGAKNLVIADAGNRRVIVYNPRTKAIELTITHPQMVNPTGVFVARDQSAYVNSGDIYVADPNAGRIFRFNSAGILLESFVKPVSIMFQSLEFQPEKIAVDKAGIMYVVAKGIADGIVQLSNTGDFLGFFSANKVRLNLRERIQQLIYTDEQLENLGLVMTPPVFTSIFIDRSGIVYSSSSGIKVENIKKHNTQGNNMIADMFISSTRLSDIYVDKNGIIYTADQTGLIAVYTSDGEFIYTFGAAANIGIAGFFQTLMALAVDDDGIIWTLDSGNNYLQSFVPTAYASAIYQAINLYNETEYEESIAVWQEVLKLNQLSILAHNGLAKNYMQTEEFALAAEHFKIAGNRDLFSEAFWEIRNLWLQANIIGVVGLSILLGALYLALRLTDRRYHYLQPIRSAIARFKDSRPIADILYSVRVAKKPADSFYYLRRSEKGSALGALILLGLTFLSYLLYTAGKGFIFQYVALKNLDLSSIILGFVLIIGLFIICSYLVTSIQDGEGTLAEIFKGISYSTYPFIIGCILTVGMSYVATNNELFLLNVVFFGGLFWSAILIFVSIAEIQNYTITETIKSILMTILFVMVILLVVSFVQMTIGQLYRFFEEMIKEVIRNLTA